MLHRYTIPQTSISDGTLKADPDKTKVFTDVSISSNASELRRFLTIVQYVMKFTSSLATKTQRLRDNNNKGLYFFIFKTDFISLYIIIINITKNTAPV